VVLNALRNDVTHRQVQFLAVPWNNTDIRLMRTIQSTSSGATPARSIAVVAEAASFSTAWRNHLNSLHPQIARVVGPC